MAQDKQLAIAASQLEEMVLVIEALKDTVAINADFAGLRARANRAITPAIQLLRASQGPQSFSGTEIGDYRVDATQSSFL